MIENVETSLRLQDRTALLTGPCTSVHQAIATKLTQMGVNVAWAERKAEKSWQMVQRFCSQLMDAKEIHDRYGRAVAVPGDFSNKQAVQETVSRAAECFGGLDLYVDGIVTSDFFSMKQDGFTDHLSAAIEMNLHAPLLLTQAVLKYLEGRKRGRIIYLLHDLPGRVGLPGTSASGSARQALAQASRALANEFAGFKITVNCVAMGVTEEFVLSLPTDPNSIAGFQPSIQSQHERLMKQYPDAWMVEPERVANMVAFLLSPLGAGVTGQTISVNR